MPDISMCPNNACPAKYDCYRYTATPSEFRQAYMDFKPDELTGICGSFWDRKTWEVRGDM